MLLRIFCAFNLMLFFNPIVLAAEDFSSVMTNNVDPQKHFVGVYSGSLGEQPLEIALWFASKGFKSHQAELGGYAIVGNENCLFKIKSGSAWSEDRLEKHSKYWKWNYKQYLKNHKDIMASSARTDFLGNVGDCIKLGMKPIGYEIRTELAIAGSENQEIAFKLRNFYSGGDQTYLGRANRSQPSKKMTQLISEADKYFGISPNQAELALLTNAKQSLTPQLFDDLVPLSCAELTQQTVAQLNEQNIESVASYVVDNKRYLRIKALNMPSYAEFEIASSDMHAMSDEQWKNLNFNPDSAAILGKIGCAVNDAYKAAKNAKLFTTYRVANDNRLDESLIISTTKDMYIVEATGVDLVKVPKRKSYAQKSTRVLGSDGLFRPGDETRTIVWMPGTQKAYALSHFKDFHNEEIHIDKDKSIEAIFSPAYDYSEKYAHTVLSLASTEPSDYSVCHKWLGEFGKAKCAEPVPKIAKNEIFITDDYNTAVALYKELSPHNQLLNAEAQAAAFNKNCITEDFCDFPAASFITSIYSNNYGAFKKENLKYSQGLLQRYSDHIYLTNVILESFGYETSKENKLNLFPYFAEYYLHLFDKKYPSCKRPTKEINIRTDTMAYKIVDGYGNTVQDVDSVALYSTYNVPVELQGLCNKLCGQTGPARALSDFANAMTHSSMVNILDGLHATMENYSCDSPEIKQLEQGLSGIYDSLISRHKQAPYYERSSRL